MPPFPASAENTAAESTSRTGDTTTPSNAWSLSTVDPYERWHTNSKWGFCRMLCARASRAIGRAIGCLVGVRSNVCAEANGDTLLAGVIADLDDLNRRTERDFLAVGGKLVEFHGLVRQVSLAIGDLRQLIAASSRDNNSQLLVRILDESRQTEARVEAGDRALAVVCEAARRIEDAFREFWSTVSEFDVLGSLLRIETARLGAMGAEFGNVAEELNALTQSVRTIGHEIVDVSLLLRKSVQSALARVAGLRARGLQTLPALAAEVVKSLESMEERNRCSHDASLRQSAEYDEVSSSIEDLIGAIQFHDITRQQVEHVADALRRLRSECAGDGRACFLAQSDARAAVRLQVSQLSNAAEIFAASVGRIEHDLDNIAARVANMAEASAVLAGRSTDEGGPFLVQLERRFTAILTILGACSQAEAETRSVLGELESTVARLRESAGKVVEIEVKLRRIAINSSIRAVQIGGTGNVLGLLAEVMQRLALSVGAISAVVSEALNLIREATGPICTSSGPIPEGEHSGAETVASRLRATIVDLHSSSDATSRRLSEIVALSSRLRDEIQAVRADFAAGPMFATAIRASRSALEEMSGLDDLGGAGGTGTQTGHDLSDYAALYTMQAERDVHGRMTAGAAVEHPAPATSSAILEADPLGENVELF